MSPRPPDAPRAPLHDPAFDAAWRAASSEAPPPVLDAAILAAARRAVDAGPRRVPEATRPERWWWPLAAAATIGAIAIGILQLGAPDKNGAPAMESAIVTDMPAAPAQAPKTDAAPDPARQPQTGPDAETDVAAAAKDARESAVPERRAPVSANAIPAPAPVAPAPPAAAPQARAPMAAAPTAEKPVAAESVPASVGAVAPSPAAQPFPAGALERREMAVGETPRPTLGKLSAGAAADAGTATRALQHAPLPVAEWLALIRKLRADGRVDDAARELAAFRLAHPDEARRLPDDLRDWRPAEK